jgi:hypothetical protein
MNKNLIFVIILSIYTFTATHATWVEESQAKEGARIVKQLRDLFPSKRGTQHFFPQLWFRIKSAAPWPGIIQYASKMEEFLNQELQRPSKTRKPKPSISHFLYIEWDLDSIRKPGNDKKFLLDLNLIAVDFWSSSGRRKQFNRIKAVFSSLGLGKQSQATAKNQYSYLKSELLDYSLYQDYNNISEHAQSLIHRGSTEFLDQLYENFALNLNLRVTTNGVFEHELDDETGLYKEPRVHDSLAVKYAKHYPTQLVFRMNYGQNLGAKVEKVYTALLRNSGPNLEILGKSEMKGESRFFEVTLDDPGKVDKRSNYTVLFSAAPLDFLEYYDMSVRRVKNRLPNEENKHLARIVKDLIEKKNWSFDNLFSRILARPLHYFALSEESRKTSRGAVKELPRMLLDRDINGVGLIATNFNLTVYK